LDDGLGGESVGGHIVTAFVIAGENPADLAGLDLWLDCPNNFLTRFLPCQGSITMIILAKNHLCDGLITQTRSNSNLKTRCKGLEGDVGIAKTIGGIVSTLVMFIFLFRGFLLLGSKGSIIIVAMLKLDLRRFTVIGCNGSEGLEELLAADGRKELRTTGQGNGSKEFPKVVGGCCILIRHVVIRLGQESGEIIAARWGPSLHGRGGGFFDHT
jgi:hypothetical protein